MMKRDFRTVPPRTNLPFRCQRTGVFGNLAGARLIFRIAHTNHRSGGFMASIKLLGIAGSLRKASTNRGLLRAARSRLPEGAEMEIADLSDIPFYNQDIAEKPAPVRRVLAQIEAADALALASAEYNYSLAPALKNILDWASREPDNTLLAGKPVAILGAGGGMGTSRAQYHLRQICVFLDLRPLNKPEVFANAFAGGFDGDGNPVDEKLIGHVAELMRHLVDAVAARR
jgi:chromate reductase